MGRGLRECGGRGWGGAGWGGAGRRGGAEATEEPRHREGTHEFDGIAVARRPSSSRTPPTQLKARAPERREQALGVPVGELLE